jgi:hypothetical protein
MTSKDKKELKRLHKKAAKTLELFLKAYLKIQVKKIEKKL